MTKISRKYPLLRVSGSSTLTFLIIVSSFVAFTEVHFLSAKFTFTNSFSTKVFLLLLSYIFKYLIQFWVEVNRNEGIDQIPCDLTVIFACHFCKFGYFSQIQCAASCSLSTSFPLSCTAAASTLYWPRIGQVGNFWLLKQSNILRKQKKTTNVFFFFFATNNSRWMLLQTF